jgi:exodeoxyribonuclease VII large subunit
MITEPERRVLTVSQLTQRIKECVEGAFGGFWVEGEISNLRIPSSGHCYFTLKDEGAQIRVALFRNRARRIRFEPRDGLHVLAFGAIEVYSLKGEYQLVVELLEPQGIGALQLAFEQLKAKLEAEGLFDASRKRPILHFPRAIGVVTSPTGAALRDILNILSRRFANLHIVVCPVRVQGEEAPGEIVHAIQALNQMGGLDVMILARGGGSIEDLWAFNQEMVARAIVASKVPVISAVGHEIDFTIADFVADLRAPTPSAAAELVVKEKETAARQLGSLAERLTHAGRRRLEQLSHRVAELGRRRVLTDPARPLRDSARRLDDLALRLGTGLRLSYQRVRHRSLTATNSLRIHSPLAKITRCASVLEQLHGRLRESARREVERRRLRLGAMAGQLESMSPLGVLRRGYSLCLSSSGALVRRASDVEIGGSVHVMLHEGTLNCRVEERAQDEHLRQKRPD